MSYTSISDVRVYLPYNYDVSTTSSPTESEVTNTLIPQSEAMLEAALKLGGFTLPIAGAQDLSLIKGLVARYVAAQVMRILTITEEAPNTNILKYEEIWERFLDAFMVGKGLIEQGSPANFLHTTYGQMNFDDSDVGLGNI